MNYNMGRKNCESYEKNALEMIENHTMFDEINLKNNEVKYEQKLAEDDKYEVKILKCKKKNLVKYLSPI